MKKRISIMKLKDLKKKYMYMTITYQLLHSQHFCFFLQAKHKNACLILTTCNQNEYVDYLVLTFI